VLIAQDGHTERFCIGDGGQLRGFWFCLSGFSLYLCLFLLCLRLVSPLLPWVSLLLRLLRLSVGLFLFCVGAVGRAVRCFRLFLRRADTVGLFGFGLVVGQGNRTPQQQYE